MMSLEQAKLIAIGDKPLAATGERQFPDGERWGGKDRRGTVSPIGRMVA